MADFTFGDILGRAVSNRISNRSQQVLDTLENPGAAFENRANAAMGETSTATTQSGALPLPAGVAPSQAGAGRGFVNPRFARQPAAAAVPEVAPTAGAVAPVEPAAAPPANVNASAFGVGAQSGRRFAADQNNPSGLGWNGKTWNTYDTPEEGVNATNALVGRYLSGSGPLRGVATPENVVSTWTTGGKTPGEKVQNGAYVQSVRRELASAGIQLNEDGSIPNTPEARQAITRAIVTHETLPQHRERFAPFLGGAVAPSRQTASSAAAPGIQTRPAINQETGEIYQEIVPENERIPPGQPFRVTVPLYGTTATAAVAPSAAVAPAPAPAPEAAPAVGGFTGQGLRGPGGESEQQKNYYSVLNSNDHKSLMALAYDLSTPPNIARMAMDRLHTDIETTRKVQKAEQDLAKFAQTQNPTQLVRAMNDKDTGSIFKAYLFKRLGLDELAQQEQQKISPSFTYSPITLPTGENYSVKFNKSTGEVISANDASGKPVTDPAQLGSIAAMAVATKNLGQSGATFYRDSKGNQWSQVPTPTGARFINVNTGQPGRPEGTLTPITAGGDLETYVAKKNIDLATDWAQLQMKIQGAGPEAANKFLGEFNAKYQLQVPMSSITGPAPQLDINTGQLRAQPQAQPGRPSAPAPAPQMQAAPQAGAVAPQAPAPAPAPGAAPMAPPAGAVSPQAAAAIPQVAAAPAPGQTPAQVQAAADAAAAAARESATAPIQIATATEKEYRTKFLPELNNQAVQASDVRTYRKSITDIMTRNPQLIGFMQGTGGGFDETRNILRDLVAGRFKDQEDLSARIAKLNFPDTPEGRQAKAAWSEIENLQRQIAPSTLKAVAGAGAVSEAEQKANRETIGDVTRLPVYTAFTINTRDQFQKDLKIAERDWAQGKTFTSDTQHSTEWAKEKKRLQDEYDAIYRARAEYIAKYKGAPGAVIDAFKLLPQPEYVPGQGWTYGGESERVRRRQQQTQSRPPLGSFVR